MRRPKAPDSLGDAGKALWASVLRVYELSPAEVALLGRACRTADVLALIDAAIADDGVTAEGSMGQVRSHPLLASKADQERVLCGLLRDLALPMPDEVTGRRRSPAAVASAQARWRAQRG